MERYRNFSQPSRYYRNDNGKAVTAVILVLIVFGLIGVVAYLVFFNSSSDSSDDDNTANVSTTPTVSPTSSVSLTQTPSISPTSSTTTPTSNTLTTTPLQTLSPSPTSGLATTPSTTGAVTPTADESGNREIKIFYSHSTDSIKDPSYAFYFLRTTPREDLETFAIEQLIAGPSAYEISTYNVFTPIKLVGESNCNGKDFKLTTTSTKVEVQFCKDLDLSRENEGSRIRNLINYTIDQFGEREVTILKKDGSGV